VLIKAGVGENDWPCRRGRVLCHGEMVSKSEAFILQGMRAAGSGFWTDEIEVVWHLEQVFIRLVNCDI
jgi:hypothetical protein